MKHFIFLPIITLFIWSVACTEAADHRVAGKAAPSQGSQKTKVQELESEKVVEALNKDLVKTLDDSEDNPFEDVYRGLEQANVVIKEAWAILIRERLKRPDNMLGISVKALQHFHNAKQVKRFKNDKWDAWSVDIKPNPGAGVCLDKALRVQRVQAKDGQDIFKLSQVNCLTREIAPILYWVKEGEHSFRIYFQYSEANHILSMGYLIARPLTPVCNLQLNAEKRLEKMQCSDFGQAWLKEKSMLIKNLTYNIAEQDILKFEAVSLDALEDKESNKVVVPQQGLIRCEITKLVDDAVKPVLDFKPEASGDKLTPGENVAKDVAAKDRVSEAPGLVEQVPEQNSQEQGLGEEQGSYQEQGFEAQELDLVNGRFTQHQQQERVKNVRQGLAGNKNQQPTADEAEEQSDEQTGEQTDGAWQEAQQEAQAIDSDHAEQNIEVDQTPY